MECNESRPITFQEAVQFSKGPGTEIRPRSTDLYSMTAANIVQMIEISDHQTDAEHVQRHASIADCQSWSFEENSQHYLIILDSIYTVPVDIFSSFLSSFIYPEIPGLTPTRTLSPRRSPN
jgi:hypothetical protein